MLDKETKRKIQAGVARREKACRDIEIQRRIAEAEKEAKRLQAKQDYELEIKRYASYEFEHSPISEVPDDVKMPNDYFDEVANKVEYNSHYADYYWQRYLDTNLSQYQVESQQVRDCHKNWFGDHYRQSGIFNVKRVFHCHNRWCWLCNHLKQAKNLYEYTLRFNELLKEHDLYHVVFTVPNVKGDVLKFTLDNMQRSLKKIIRYFQGFGKITDVDFEQYGFFGAIRSFEIVIGPYEYHPHIHCLFLLNKGLDFPKTEINKFSFNVGCPTPQRKFSKFEITLQKMFYLIFNGYRVNMSSIHSCKIGYSCTMDHVEGDRWHEVFKYATKMSKDGASVCTYEQFCLLDDILYKFKMIQGYGYFYNMKDTIKDDNSQVAEILFEKVLILLNQKETPERDIKMALDKIVDEIHKKKLTCISKNLSYKYLKKIMDEVNAEFNKSLGLKPGETAFPF